MKREIFCILILLVLSIYFLVRHSRENFLLKKHGVFVLGKLDHASSEGEISWMYYYRYFFNGKTFERSFTGPIRAEILKDSLMFFKVLPGNPSICQQLSDVRVPKCLLLASMPPTGWKELPSSSFCDSVKKAH